MDPISEQAIRNSFVNCTKGEASRMRLPVNFREIGGARPPRLDRSRRSTTGLYFCADLACSLYIRGKKQPKLRLTAREETLTVEERVARTRDNLADFLAKVTAA